MEIKIIYKDERNNMIIGSNPDAVDTELNFYGSDNILFCEEDVKFTGSTINFMGNNSLVYICHSSSELKIDIKIFTDSVFHIGKESYINENLNVILSEHKHCFIGHECLVSSGVNIRTADAHLIYDCNTKLRLNPSESVYIGDHVWLGQNVFILKGTQIDSGSILGAMSVAAGKKIGHNESWAGNPCKLIKQNVFWDNLCVHAFRKTETDSTYNYYTSSFKADDTEHAVFSFNDDSRTEWSDLEKFFSSDIKCIEKCEFIMNLNNQSNKNRFVHSSH